MELQPIDRPQRGQPMLASWGAAVADGVNTCAGELADLRGPGAVRSLREPKGAAKDGLFPFLVRFVPDPEGDGTEGVLIIYIPPGSLTVNGTAAEQDVYPLSPYTDGDYADKEHWYELESSASECTYWLNFDFKIEDGEFDSVGFSDTSDDGDDDHSVISRSIAIASIDITPADGGTRGRVTVNQITKGPLVYEVGVQSLNGMVGHLNVKADKDGVEVDGKTLYATVSEDSEDGSIVIGLTDEEPDEDDDGDNGYCNDISGDGNGGDTKDDDGNEISHSDDANDANGNAVSQDPCKKGST